jgi:hypothetical protein
MMTKTLRAGGEPGSLGEERGTATATQIIVQKRAAIEATLLNLEAGSTVVYSVILAFYIACGVVLGGGASTYLTGAFAVLIGATGAIIGSQIWILRSSIKEIEAIVLREVSDPSYTASRLWLDRLMEFEQSSRRGSFGGIMRTFKLVEAVFWLVILGATHAILVQMAAGLV